MKRAWNAQGSALGIALALGIAALLSAATARAESTSRLAELRGALHAADKESDAALRGYRSRLGNDPLWQWVEYAALRRQTRPLSEAEVRTFLDRYGDTPASAGLRALYLRQLATREDWQAYRRWYAGSDDVVLQCHALTARIATDDAARTVDDALAMWMSGDSVDSACDLAFAELRRRGLIGSEQIRRRIALAVERGNTGLIRFLARELPADERATVERYARFIETPDSAPAQWPKSALRDAVIRAGLQRIARRNPEAAVGIANALTPSLSADLLGDARNAIALWTAANGLPSAQARMREVPPQAFDARLHEWHVRSALSASDAQGALDAIAAMPTEQRLQPRWQLAEARLREARGQTELAKAAYQRAAGSPSFHGFLAADIIQQPYALCPLAAPRKADAAPVLQDQPGLQRALDLFQLDRVSWATQEWNRVVPALPLPMQAAAVKRALDVGWYDRAAQTLGSGEGMRYYRQRFPQPYARSLRAEARQHDLDPAWVAGLIRSESVWMANARSHADARGLMQLLPGTGQLTARRLGMPWKGGDSLYHAPTNLRLGTAYLRQMRDRYNGQAFLATAAYNAGPGAVERWLTRRPMQGLLADPILWIETIPFLETRDYVARVMAFSVIYDWRAKREPRSLWARLRGERSGTSAGFQCPAM